MFPVTVILMLRIKRKTRNRIPITWLTVHRLFATALLIAHKNVDSECKTSNKYYAVACGLDMLGMWFYEWICCVLTLSNGLALDFDGTELNKLERIFLIEIDFDVHVSREEVRRYTYNLCQITCDHDSCIPSLSG